MSNDADGAPIFAALSLTNYGEVTGTGLDLSARYFPAAHWTAELTYSHFTLDVRRDLPDQPITANTGTNRVSAAVSYARAPAALSLGPAGPMRFPGLQVSFADRSRPMRCSTRHPLSAWAVTTLLD